MKMKYLILITYLFVISAGCKDETEVCESPCYSGERNGFFVVNEGPFQRGSGTILFYDSGQDKTCQRVYQRANCSEELGNIVQSMEFFGDEVFIVVNNSDKVIVADKKTFKFKKVVKDITLPRYFLPIDEEKSFITYWGNPGGVAVLDMNTYNVEKHILTGDGPEKMIQLDNDIYVVNSGGFGRDSTIVVIDIETESIVNTIVVGDNPNSILMDKTGALWVMCAGYTDWNNPDSLNDTSGKLVKIVDGLIDETIAVERGGKNLVIDKFGERLYFTTGGVSGKVYRLDVDSPNHEVSLFYDHSFYSLGFDKEHNHLIGADCKDFNAAGEIFIIDGNTGSLEKSIFVGLIPGNFAFLNN